MLNKIAFTAAVLVSAVAFVIVITRIGELS
jgi:hypothetical protein